MSKFIKKMFSKVIGKQQTTDSPEGDVYAKHNIKDSMDIVMKNIYAKRCTDDIVETGFGKLCANLNTDVLTQEAIKRAGKDYIKSGNCFFEIVEFEGKISKIYHVPANTMKIEKLPSKKLAFKQLGNEDIVYSQYDPKSLSTAKTSSILHIMNYEDDSIYGTPVWIAAKLKLQQSYQSDEYVDSFYNNDAIPAGALLTKGAELDDVGAQGLNDMMSGRNKGARNRRNLLHIHMDEESDMKYLKFNENIVDNSFITLQRENKVDVCAAFGVPPKRVGLETPGRLGGGNDYSAQLNGYYEDIIIPLQMLFEEKLPFENLEFTRPKIKVVTESIEKKDKSNSFFNDLREILIAN